MVDATSAIQKLTAQLAADNTEERQARAEQLNNDREMLEKMEKDLKEQGLEAKDNQKFRDAQIALQKEEFDFRKSNAVGKAAHDEIK